MPRNAHPIGVGCAAAAALRLVWTLPALMSAGWHRVCRCFAPFEGMQFPCPCSMRSSQVHDMSRLEAVRELHESCPALVPRFLPPPPAGGPPAYGEGNLPPPPPMAAAAASPPRERETKEEREERRQREELRRDRQRCVARVWETYPAAKIDLAAGLGRGLNRVACRSNPGSSIDRVLRCACWRSVLVLGNEWLWHYWCFTHRISYRQGAGAGAAAGCAGRARRQALQAHARPRARHLREDRAGAGARRLLLTPAPASCHCVHSNLLSHHPADAPYKQPRPNKVLPPSHGAAMVLCAMACGPTHVRFQAMVTGTGGSGKGGSGSPSRTDISLFP